MNVPKLMLCCLLASAGLAVGVANLSNLSTVSSQDGFEFAKWFVSMVLMAWIALFYTLAAIETIWPGRR